MVRIVAAVTILAGLLVSQSAGAADQRIVSTTPAPPLLAVTVDELFLRAGGCPGRADCIAPRVLPIEGGGFARTRALRQIFIPVYSR